LESYPLRTQIQVDFISADGREQTGQQSFLRPLVSKGSRISSFVIYTPFESAFFASSWSIEPPQIDLDGWQLATTITEELSRVRSKKVPRVAADQITGITLGNALTLLLLLKELDKVGKS
jgi:hypothetical protein